MAYSIIRPRHGIKSLWKQYKSRVYRTGEMLVESPETGVGTGFVSVKFGDGVSSYENLPYAILPPTSSFISGSNNPVTADAVKVAIRALTVNSLTSTSDFPLAAAKGKVLDEKITEIQNGLTNFVFASEEPSSVDPNSIVFVYEE